MILFKVTKMTLCLHSQQVTTPYEKKTEWFLLLKEFNSRLFSVR